MLIGLRVSSENDAAYVTGLCNVVSGLPRCFSKCLSPLKKQAQPLFTTVYYRGSVYFELRAG